MKNYLCVFIPVFNALKNQKAGTGQIFNIGGGASNAPSLLEIFDFLQEFLDLMEPLAYEKLPCRQSDQDYFASDIRKAEYRLNWVPHLNASDGVSSMRDRCNISRLEA